MIKMGKDLNIDIYNDLFIIYFFCRCNAKQLDFLTLKEYETGLNYIGIDKFSDLKKKYEIYLNDLTF